MSGRLKINLRFNNQCIILVPKTSIGQCIEELRTYLHVRLACDPIENLLILGDIRLMLWRSNTVNFKCAKQK